MKTTRLFRKLLAMIIATFISIASYGQFFPGGGYQGGDYASGGDEKLLKYQQWFLYNGWSGLSGCYNPDNNSVEAMFAPIISELIILYNYSGMYWPEQGVNTLGSWNHQSGYVIKVKDDVTIAVGGFEIDDKSVYLNAGWNLIPVFSQSSAAALLGGLPGFVVAKGVATNEVLWPAYNINTLQILNLTKAYFVYMTQPGSITYAKGGEQTQYQSPGFITSTPWNDLIPTPCTHLVALTAESLKALQTGDIIAAFNPAGFCACATIISGSGDGEALILFGDDPTTETHEGFIDGELLILKCYRQSTGEVFDLEVAWEESLSHSGLFETHGLSAITSIKLTPTGYQDNLQSALTISPNPTTGRVMISGFNQKSELQILDLLGNIVFNQTLDLPAEIDLTDIPRGIYFLIVVSDRYYFSNKLILK